jgi:putative addiction module component (TIGR02574 family)
MDMSQSLPMPPPGFDALTVEEQIDYVQSLWDHIAAHPEQVPVPDWHRQVLAERMASYEANPTEGKRWEEFEKEVIQELKRLAD